MARRRWGWAWVAAGAVLTAGACGSGSGDGSETAAATGTTRTEPVVRTATLADFGSVVVDADGMTLYRNAMETGATIACTGTCAETWPPLPAPAKLGSSDDPVGSVARPDGSLQVTWRGQPLYRYVADGVPGDAKGHGVGAIWFVVPEAGTGEPAPATTTAPTAAPAVGAAATTTTAPTTTTRPRAASQTATSGATTPAAPATAPAPATTAPPTTAATAPPPTPAPTSPAPTSPPATSPPPTGGYCDYPPCDP